MYYVHSAVFYKKHLYSSTQILSNCRKKREEIVFFLKTKFKYETILSVDCSTYLYIFWCALESEFWPLVELHIGKRRDSFSFLLDNNAIFTSYFWKLFITELHRARLIQLLSCLKWRTVHSEHWLTKSQGLGTSAATVQSFRQYFLYHT